MRKAAFALILLGAVAGSSEAQVRGRGNSQGIPPGQMPRPGECRVWYDNRPPGRQPAPTNCDQAERIASRSRDARVIYGEDRYATRNRDERYRDRSAGSSRYPDVYGNSYPDNRGYGYNAVPFQNGERDGYEKGRKDARDNDSYDPVRHSWYRSGDRGYNNRYGTRDAYKLTYRDGFESGYERGYREVRGYGSNRGNTGRYRLPRF
jgi:hypothetical protein